MMASMARGKMDGLVCWMGQTVLESPDAAVSGKTATVRTGLIS